MFLEEVVFGDLAVAAYTVPRVWPSVGGKGRKSVQCGGFKNNDCGCDIFLKLPVKVCEGQCFLVMVAIGTVSSIEFYL